MSDIRQINPNHRKRTHDRMTKLHTKTTGINIHKHVPDRYHGSVTLSNNDQHCSREVYIGPKSDIKQC